MEMILRRSRLEDFILRMATVITNAGRAIVTNLFQGAGTEPKYLGWGTGTQTTALVTDTTLGPTTVERDVDLSGTTGTRTTCTGTRQTTNVANDTVQYVGTRTASGAGTVTCAGLFDNSAIGSGNMFLKGDFAGIALSSGDAILFTAKGVFA